MIYIGRGRFGSYTILDNGDSIHEYLDEETGELVTIIRTEHLDCNGDMVASHHVKRVQVCKPKKGAKK